MNKRTITSRENSIPWRDLHGADFEQMCFQLIAADPEYTNVKHTGAVGSDGGRDISADKGNEKWCFQCKNIDRLTYKEAVSEINKLYNWLEPPPNKYVFVGPFSASQDLQFKLRKYGHELTPSLEVDFICASELTAFAYKHPLVLKRWFDKGRPGEHLAASILGQSETLRAKWAEWTRRSRPLTLPLTSDLKVQDLEPPLNMLWKQFIDSEPWHVVMQSHVRNMCQQFAVLVAEGVCRETLWEDAISVSRAINWQCHYDLILESLNKFVGVAKAAISLFERERDDGIAGDVSYVSYLIDLKCRARELRKAIVSPRFGTCFLVSGSHGSGKSFFIEQLRRKAADDPRQPIFIFPYMEGYRSTPEEAVLREMERVFGSHDLRSLSEVTKCFSEAQTKLVIVIEDVQMHCSVRSSFLESLVSCVENNTASGCVRWLITVNDSDYSDVARHRHAFMKASHSFVSDDASIVGGWVRLDELNRNKVLPSELWMSNRSPQTGANPMPESERRREALCAARVLPTPLVACIAVEVARRQRNDSLYGLSYIGILTSFWEHLLDRHGAAYGLADYSTVACAVEVLAELSVKGGSFSIDRSCAEEALRSCGESVTLDSLQRLSLLATDPVPGVDLVAFDKQLRRVHLIFELLWSYHLAYCVAKQWRGDQVNGVESANNACLDRCRAVCDVRTRELVYEHVLLLADELAERDRPSGGVTREHATALWTRVLDADCQGGEAAAYHAGLKATSGRQSDLVSWLRRENREVTSPRAICALMDFLREAGTVSLKQCLQILRNKTSRDGSPFRRIADADLGECFLFLFRRRCENSKGWTHDDLNTLLNLLGNCDIMGYAREVAEIVWGRYRRDSKGHGGEIVVAIQQYLVQDVVRVHEEQKDRQRPDGGRPVFLREWFLQMSLAELLREYGPSLCEDLRHRRWFLKGKNRLFHSEIAHQVRQHWCLAFGKWYRDNAKIDQHSLDIASKLIRSGRDEGYERRLGYFMMRATGQGEGRAPRRIGREWAKVVQAGGNSIEKLLHEWPICYG